MDNVSVVGEHTPGRGGQCIGSGGTHTLMKCRSQKVLGVQLQITLMLLARSMANKQVRTSAPANVINNHINTEGPKYCCMKESDVDFFSRLSQF